MLQFRLTLNINMRISLFSDQQLNSVFCVFLAKLEDIVTKSSSVDYLSRCATLQLWFAILKQTSGLSYPTAYVQEWSNEKECLKGKIYPC